MENTYTRSQIVDYISAIRGKPYTKRHQAKLLGMFRDRVGQMKFTHNQACQILGFVVLRQLYPQRAALPGELTQEDLEEFKTSLNSVLLQVPKLKSVSIPDNADVDIEFVCKALVACGFPRYSPVTVQQKLRNYLRDRSSSKMRQEYDYSHISGAVVNGFLEWSYQKMIQKEAKLTSRDKHLSDRISKLKEVVELLQPVQISPNTPSHLDASDRIKRSITKIQNDMRSYGSDEDAMRLICLRFIKRYGKQGRRLLSLATHPDTCKTRNAGIFQRVLNACAEYESGVNAVGEKIEMAIAVVEERVKEAKLGRVKRKFHHSPKWKAYVERRRSSGWHKRYWEGESAV